MRLFIDNDIYYRNASCSGHPALAARVCFFHQSLIYENN